MNYKPFFEYYEIKSNISGVYFLEKFNCYTWLLCHNYDLLKQIIVKGKCITKIEIVHHDVVILKFFYLKAEKICQRLFENGFPICSTPYANIKIKIYAEKVEYMYTKNLVILKSEYAMYIVDFLINTT